jgi:hypothetical protein
LCFSFVGRGEGEGHKNVSSEDIPMIKPLQLRLISVGEVINSNKIIIPIDVARGLIFSCVKRGETLPVACGNVHLTWLLGSTWIIMNEKKESKGRRERK